MLQIQSLKKGTGRVILPNIEQVENLRQESEVLCPGFPAFLTSGFCFSLVYLASLKNPFGRKLITNG